MKTKIGGFIAKILLFLLVASFAVWGIGDIFRGGGTNQTVAKVDRTKISASALDRAFRNQVNNMRQFMSSLTISQAVEFGLLQGTLDDMIDRHLVNKEVNDLGISIPDDVMVGRVREILSGKDGSYDPQMLTYAARASGTTEQEFLEMIREETARKKLVDMLQTNIIIPSTLVGALHLHDAEQRRVALMKLEPKKLQDFPSPGDEELKLWHSDKADSYMAPEYRGVTIGLLTTKSVAKDIPISDAEVKERYDVQVANMKEISPEIQPAPYDEMKDSIRLSMQKEQAGDQMYELSNQINDTLAGGASILEVIEQYGLEERSYEQIDISGRLADGEEVSTLPQKETILPVIFQAQAGQPSIMMEMGSEGYFMFEVTQITPASVRAYEEVSADVLKDWQQAQQRKDLSERSVKAKEFLNTSAGSFAQAAEKFGGTSIGSALLSRDGEGSEDVSKSLADQIFTLEIGQHATAPRGENWILAQLYEIVPGDLETLEDKQPETLIDEISSDRIEQFTHALRKDASIQINALALQRLSLGYIQE